MDTPDLLAPGLVDRILAHKPMLAHVAGLATLAAAELGSVYVASKVSDDPKVIIISGLVGLGIGYAAGTAATLLGTYRVLDARERMNLHRDAAS